MEELEFRFVFSQIELDETGEWPKRNFGILVKVEDVQALLDELQNQFNENRVTHTQMVL